MMTRTNNILGQVVSNLLKKPGVKIIGHRHLVIENLRVRKTELIDGDQVLQRGGQS